MIKDLAKTFEKYFRDESIIRNSYELQNGIYFLYTKQGDFKNMLEVNKDTENVTDIYEYFKDRDYYSHIFIANKCIPNNLQETVNGKECNMIKKIFSNNYLTVFFKNKTIEGMSGEYVSKNALPVEFFKKGLEQYYEANIQIDNITNEKEKMILERMENINISHDNIYQIKKIAEKVFDDVYQRVNQIKDIKKEIWIKIFFEDTLEEYSNASIKYRMLRLFNKNDRNIRKENGEVYGINDYNYGSNSKKPYLESKTTPYKMTLTPLEEEVLLRNMYVWILKNVTNRRYAIIPVTYDFKGDLNSCRKSGSAAYLIRAINDNGVAKIEECEFINSYSEEIDEFKCDNYVSDIVIEDFGVSAKNNEKLQGYISRNWFSGYLEASYYDYDNVVKKAKGLPSWKKEILKVNSRIFKDLLLKQQPKKFIAKLNDIGYKITVNTLLDEIKDRKTYNSIKAMSLWLALDEYYNNKKEMGIKVNLENIREKAKVLMETNGRIEDAETYYFLVGQITYFLISKSKASELKQDMFEPILNAGNNYKIKKSLRFLYEKYCHELYLHDSRFNNAFSKILEKDDDEYLASENKNVIIYGLLTNNLFFNKKEDGGKENGKEE